MLVTVSAFGLYHAHHAALAAAQQGWLRYWITSAPAHRDRDVDPAHVRYLRVPAYLRYGVERLLPGTWGQFTAINVADNLFDLLASRYAADCNIFHVFNHQGLLSMRRAARHGALTIVDRGSAHIRAQLALLREEFARHGQRLPDLRWPMEWKHVQEYAEADHIVVCSEYVRRTMVAQGVPADKMTVIHVGVDLDTFKPQPRQDDVFRVLFVGVANLRKGIHHLLEAFKGLAVPDAELVLVSRVSPEVSDTLRRYSDLFRFIPGVPQHELPALYSSASVLVMPSITEGFGMVAAEAMACGVPVVVSENVGIPVEDGRHGFVVPIRDPQAIREKLLYLYENPDERRAMGERARVHAQQFAWHNYHRQLVALYRRLAGRERG